MDKASQGVQLIVEAIDEAPDEYRRAFALCLALSRLADAARTSSTKTMLQAAARGDMRDAPAPDFIQAAQAEIGRRLDMPVPEVKRRA